MREKGDSLGSRNQTDKEEASTTGKEREEEESETRE